MNKIIIGLMIVGLVLIASCAKAPVETPPTTEPTTPPVVETPPIVETAPVVDDYKACSDVSRNAEICPSDYDPVCADMDNGIRCVTFPCPNVDKKTFPNVCNACKNPKTYGYVKGACVQETVPPVEVTPTALCGDLDQHLAGEYGYTCATQCPDGQDSYTAPFGLKVCITHYGVSEFQTLNACTKKGDCDPGDTCGYALLTTTKEKLYWSGSIKDNNNQPVQALRCLPPEYVEFAKNNAGLTAVDENGRKTVIRA